MTKQDVTEMERMLQVPPQVKALRDMIRWDREHLAAQLRQYRNERGPVMRPYRRDLCRKTIRCIRAAQANLKTWGVQS